MSHLSVVALVLVFCVACNDSPAGFVPSPPSNLIPPENHAPVASIAAPSEALQGDDLTFDGRGSSDADKDSLVFVWDLGDGAVRTGALVSHAYAREGSYTVRLIVRDPGAAADTASLTVRITPQYEMTDLGTLGSEYIFNAVIDDEGRVTAVGGVADAIHVYRWKNGVTSDLGPLPGPGVLSPHGLVAGTACHRVFPDQSNADYTGVCTFYLFNEGTITPLETDGVAFEDQSGVNAVLDDGTVVGTVQYKDRVVGVIWKNGVRTELPQLDVHSKTYPSTMNARGQLIGQAVGPRGMRPYLWQNGVARDVGGLFDKPCSDPSASCGTTYLLAINNHGDMVGYSMDSSRMRAVIWRNGGPPADLGVLPGDRTGAEAINDRGDIYGVGGAGFDPWWAMIDGVVYGPGNPVNPGGIWSTPISMSERGEIVGYLSIHALQPDHEWHSFVWRTGRMIDLGPGPYGSVQGEAIGINERGDVLGLYVDERGQGLQLWRPVRSQTSRMVP